MKLEKFEMERMQSEWENRVKYNLSESGVHPISIKELVAEEDMQKEFLNLGIGYSQTNGTIPLRQLISSEYDGTGPDNVLVTNGGAEANYLCMWNLLRENGPGSELVMMLPNYMQMYGVWRNLGGVIKPFHLKLQNDEWVPDIEELKEVVSKKTVGIAICNPNNPTGATLDKHYLKAIADIAADSKSWLISDEIYRGAEPGGLTTPTIFGLHDKVMITSSLSKAYGLPGLRIGWVVCSDPEKTHELWAYSDYTSICPSKVSDWLAIRALQPEMKEKLIKRGRKIVGRNWSIMKAWLDTHSSIIDYAKPRASAICFPHHKLEVSSKEIVGRLLREKSVLVVPGEQFGMPNYLRFGFGYEENLLKEALALVSEILQEYM